ncbi:MAG: zinc/manganese transport system substrate-binding protein [Lysobacterales bacterium]|jgi:zinc/manganese transport system substrate-binding protein
MRIALVFCLLFAGPLVAQADLKVFACEPEWASLVQELGGDLTEVNSATHALQDPHYIQARPSLISKMRRADLVICSGADLEIGWLPKLLEKANNPRVRPGNAGFFESSTFVARLDVPASVDRAQGDMHPQGNPHVHLNPHNMLLIAEALALRLGKLDSDNASFYQKNLLSFKEKWSAAIVRWEEAAASLKGRKIIAHHKSWVYLEEWLGLQEIATLEPVAGVPPTASHLAALLSELGEDGKGADLIIRAPYQSEKASLWLSERTAIPAVMLPLTVGGSDKAVDLYSMFDDIVDRLINAR